MEISKIVLIFGMSLLIYLGFVFFGTLVSQYLDKALIRLDFGLLDKALTLSAKLVF